MTMFTFGIVPFTLRPELNITISFVQATIDKVYFRWINLKPLMEKYPQRLVENGTDIILKGRVLIIPPLSFLTKLNYAALVGGVFGFGLGLIALIALSSIERSSSYQRERENQRGIYYTSMLAFFLGEGIAGTFVYQKLNQPGIHFY